MKTLKEVGDLTKEDFEANPVWEFVDNHKMSDTLMSPVKRLPVATLSNRVIGCEIELASGSKIWGILSNIDLADPRRNELFVSLIFLKGRRRFILARHVDVLRSRLGPAALAKFLMIPLRDIFPIKYDISAFCEGHPECLLGEIEQKPRHAMSLDEMSDYIVSQLPMPPGFPEQK